MSTTVPRRAYAFDLDGTVTTEELLPLVAARCGMGTEMRELTDATMAGDLAFEDSFRKRCEMLAAVPVSVVHDVVSQAILDPDVVRFIAAHRDDCWIVTGNLDVWVAPLVARLGCGLFSSTASTHGDSLVEVTSVLSKDDAVAALRRGYDRVVAIGDGANDVPLFRASDVSVAFGQVHPPVAALVAEADYIVYTGGSLCRLLSTL